MNWGMKLNGWYLTANFLEYPRTERGYSLSEVLEENVDKKYYLSDIQVKKLTSTSKELSQMFQENGITEAAQVTFEKFSRKGIAK